MLALRSDFRPRIAASGCVTAFGATEVTHRCLLHGRRALQDVPCLGNAGGDPVPLALVPNRTLDSPVPGSWTDSLNQLRAEIPDAPWGTDRHPVFVTSSNFGAGGLYQFRQSGCSTDLSDSTPFGSVAWIARHMRWGTTVSASSHACVSAHLGLLQASRYLEAGLADRALVFSFDYLSPFVVGGFHALKILNRDWPAPYEDRAGGAVALGDAVAFAILTRDEGDYLLAEQQLYNEMHHFTGNLPSGEGFRQSLAVLATAAAGRQVWCKGHGTGTLDAGKLEAESLRATFPGCPLVGWKGGIGHTLGSCGLVELALVLRSFARGEAPGTVGTSARCFVDEVATKPFSTASYEGAVCLSNAFGGAHAGLLVTHA